MTNLERAKEVGNGIINQIGANQFFAMTGTKIKYLIPNKGLGGVMFQLTKNKLKAKWLEIILEQNDTYTVRFITEKKGETVILKELEYIYCDQLRGLFEDVTGLRTSLTRIYGSVMH